MPTVEFDREKTIEVDDPDLTLLEIARAAGIPHASACGGNGRCSTCRVMILEHPENLTPRNGVELRLAKAKGFDVLIRAAVGQDFRVWIVRDPDGFYALFAKCTHLGCTPRWLLAEAKFKCPCHGSGYYRSGINFEGPAPRPLERLKITLAEDGQLVVDKSVKFLFEKGQWGKPGSFVKA